MGISVYLTLKRRHRCQGLAKGGTSHFCCGSWDLNKQAGSGTLGTENGLHTRATLPADGCHFYGTAIGVYRYQRDHTAIGEVDMVERTVGIHENLASLTAHLLKLRSKPLESTRRQGE